MKMRVLENTGSILFEDFISKRFIGIVINKYKYLIVMLGANGSGEHSDIVAIRPSLISNGCFEFGRKNLSEFYQHCKQHNPEYHIFDTEKELYKWLVKEN